jgi:predicted transcriptional regulator of viral defense system
MWATPSTDKEKQLVVIAANTGGYFTAKQAFDAGYNYRLQHYYRTKGYWEAVDRGIYRLPEYPSPERDDLIRWSLWSLNREGVPQAVVSHETALSVYELSDIMPAKVHLTVPFKFRKPPLGACILHRADLESEDIDKKEGFMITRPLRTLIDVSEGDLSLDYLEQAVREAFRRGMAGPQQFERVAWSETAKEKIRIILENIRKRSF